MRYVLAVLLCSLSVFAQTADQPGVQYSTYQLLLVPQQGEGFLVGIDKSQKIVFIPIPSIRKALEEDGVLPVRYGDLLQLVSQLGNENARLKAENEHLWKVAEGHGAPSAPPTTVVVQQQAPPAPDPNAEGRSLMQPETVKLLVELFRVLVTRYDEQWLKTKAAEQTLQGYPAAKEEYERRLERLEVDPAARLNRESMQGLLERLRAALLQDQEP
jgi:hypothetical protein